MSDVCYAKTEKLSVEWSSVMNDIKMLIVSLYLPSGVPVVSFGPWLKSF